MRKDSAGPSKAAGADPPGLDQQPPGLEVVPDANHTQSLFAKPFPDVQTSDIDFEFNQHASRAAGLSAGAISFSPANAQLSSPATTASGEPIPSENLETVTIVLLCHVQHLTAGTVANVKVTSPIPRSFNEQEFMMRRSTTDPKLWGVSVQLPRASTFFEYKYIVTSTDSRPAVWKENRHPRSLSLLNVSSQQSLIELNDYFQNPVRSA
jgi:hypothetical protein